MVELHQVWCHEPFIAIAACAILVYIVYAYNKSRVAFDNGILMAPVENDAFRTPLPRHISLWTILVFNPPRHLMTVSPRTA
jgi:hypothetical protein